MLRKLTAFSWVPAIVHFLVVLAYANGIGGARVGDVFDIIGQPGTFIARELGFGSFGFFGELGGNKIGLWVVMVLNSLLWGVVIGGIFQKLKPKAVA